MHSIDTLIMLAEPMGLRCKVVKTDLSTQYVFSNYTATCALDASIYIKGYIAAKAGK